MRRVSYIVRFALGELLHDLAYRVHPDWTYERTENGVITGEDTPCRSTSC